MSKSITIPIVAAAAGLLAILVHGASGQVLYENVSTFLGNFNINEEEAGNQVTLAGDASQYLITNFVFQFDFTSIDRFPGSNEMAELRLYQNDGPLVSPGGTPSPGTVLFDSGTFSIGFFTLASTANFSQADLGGGIVVPPTFTWTVTFSGLVSNDITGLGLYSPASIGTNYNSAWLNNGTNWQLITGVPIPEFGALIIGMPVPELKYSMQPGALLLSWPNDPPFFQLQAATNPSGPLQWLQVSNTFSRKGERFLSSPPSGPSTFYRLIYNTTPPQ